MLLLAFVVHQRQKYNFLFCELKFSSTTGIQLKLRCDHRSYNRKVYPEQNCRASTGFDPMASALALQRSTALPIEL